MNAGWPGEALPEGMPNLEKLREEGLVSDDIFQRAVNEARRLDVRVEEALISTGLMDEPALLKWLARRFQCQFITTRKLARAKIDPAAIQLIPEDLAERLDCCPLLYKPAAGQMFVAYVDPTIDDIAKQLSMVSGVRRVDLLIARPAAVMAARRKYYRHQQRAFQQLLLMQDALDREPAIIEDERDSIRPVASPSSSLELTGMGVGTISGLAPPPTPRISAQEPELPSPAPSAVASIPSDGISLALSPNLKIDPSRPIRRTVSLDGPLDEEVEGLESPSVASLRSFSSPPSEPGVRRGVSWGSFREATAVMINLLEQGRAELRGHSRRVARLCERFADRLGLTSETEDALVMAAYIHDVGKASSSSYHLTALNVARYEGHQAQAQKYFVTPSRLFETAQLPEDTYDFLRFLYERYDGSGFPDKLAGKDIPLGSRILAIVETYDDLVENPKNPYRKVLEPAAAASVIGELAPAIFDPSLAEVLKEIVLDTENAPRAAKVLLVDPDPEETTVLGLRFSAADWDVVIARDAAEALVKAEEPGVAAMVVEADLPDRSGFRVAEALTRAGKSFPILFLTRRSDRASIQRALGTGAVDYIVKPASADVVVAKALQASERARGRGVSGSLSEMALEDVIQILANGRKTGRLILRSANRRGEIHFGEGKVWDASFEGLRGEDAVYALLAQRSGRFELDPSFQPGERRIEHSTETLLLEGMRRLDES